MDTNPASVFDVQRLAVEQIPKSSGYITALQKPLKKVYFPFKKNQTISPPLPYLKIVAGPQFIAFSSSSQTPVALPVNTLPQFDKYFNKESVVSTAALQLLTLEKNKKIKAAFVTLDKEARLKQGKEYCDLFFTLDEKELFLTSVDHSALFVCIVKSNVSKQLDAHFFVCLNEEQALDIIKALKGELTNEQAKSSGENVGSLPVFNTIQGNVNEHVPTSMATEQYSLSYQQPYQMSNAPFYGQQHPPGPVQVGGGGYEHMFYNMHLAHQPNMPYQPIHTQPQYPPNQPMDHLTYGGAHPMQQPPVQTNFYQEPRSNSPYTNQFPQQAIAGNQGQPNPTSNDGSFLAIPRPVVSTNTSIQQEATSNLQEPLQSNANSYRASQYIQYPNFTTLQPVAPNAFSNPQPVQPIARPALPQQNQLTLVGKPNFQFSPPVLKRPESKFFQPGETALVPNTSSKRSSSGEEQNTPPCSVANQQPPPTRSEPIKPNKPTRMLSNGLHSDVKYDLKQPKKKKVPTATLR